METRRRSLTGHGVADPVSLCDGQEQSPGGGCSVLLVFRTADADMTDNRWSTRRDVNAHLQRDTEICSASPRLRPETRLDRACQDPPRRIDAPCSEPGRAGSARRTLPAREAGGHRAGAPTFRSDLMAYAAGRADPRPTSAPGQQRPM